MTHLRRLLPLVSVGLGGLLIVMLTAAAGHAAARHSPAGSSPIVLHVFAAAPTYAQPQAAQDEFVPIDELPPEERLPAAPLLIAAYGFVWLALLGYLWSIWRRLGSVEREIAEVGRRVDSDRNRAPGGQGQ